MFKLLEERSELGGDELRSEEDEVGFGFGYGGGIGGGGDDDDDDGRACVYGVLEQREERALRAVEIISIWGEVNGSRRLNMGR
ncbi:hypothetical protein QYF36_017109 [Acer negundo]|nr:hypothetical protein QYF36_017109 [Acer negundo]